jgi:hypothetical protein
MHDSGVPGWAITREGRVLHVFLPPAIEPFDWDPLFDAVQAAVAGAGEGGIAVVDIRELAEFPRTALRTSMVERLAAELKAKGLEVRHAPRDSGVDPGGTYPPG